MLRIQIMSTPNCHDFDKQMLDACIERAQLNAPNVEQEYQVTIYSSAPDREGMLEYIIQILDMRDADKDIRPFTIGAIRRPGSTQIEFHS